MGAAYGPVRLLCEPRVVLLGSGFGVGVGTPASGCRGPRFDSRLRGPRAAGGLDRGPAGVPVAGPPNDASEARPPDGRISGGHGRGARGGYRHDALHMAATADRDDHGNRPALGLRWQVSRSVPRIAAGFGAAAGQIASRV